jgi:hypothetical protein
MAGGGGWRSKTDPKANYAVAVFDTDDMQTLSGQVETGAYPSGIAFHPVLNLGAAYKDGHGAEIFLFSAKSFATKENIKVKSGAGTNILTFGGQGAKVIFAPMPGIGGEGQSTIEFLPIPLTDQDREALKKAYGK